MIERMFFLSNKVARGPRPKSFEDLIPYGIETVINLQSGAFEFFNNDEYEKQNATDFGMNEICLKLSDFLPPDEAEVTAFLSLIEKATGPVYVHCLHGKDRTGFMCAIYRMRVHGWSYEKARDEMFSFGFHKWAYSWWCIQLKKLGKVGV